MLTFYHSLIFLSVLLLCWNGSIQCIYRGRFSRLIYHSSISGFPYIHTRKKNSIHD
ncbi:hypothetical protein K450DRAFT_227968 [Umbelopsis ramanniana AG]|uniref:Uncharacterized protein n=1 Tax=Umbelopsis ramanniana AG TaxID=1314678 RepID=A0AAD5EF69_UMBRA|nr:uncharacterized protein K450DRAFT_227968 [Umbelopsis ramanniana AG]KAI8582222.1 hypothetical protein K450DRAFT_227968 [Umbelopsis ramanniana AG]